jgi:hypothetical protein
VASSHLPFVKSVATRAAFAAVTAARRRVLRRDDRSQPSCRHAIGCPLGSDPSISANDRDAATVPVILRGSSDSRWFHEAFPDCVAYGFFPQRHMTLHDTAPPAHSADERIDVRT